MDNKEKNDISADELIRRLNMTLGISNDVDSDDDDGDDIFSDTQDIEKSDSNDTENESVDEKFTETDISDDSIDVSIDENTDDIQKSVDETDDKNKKEKNLPGEDFELVDDTLTEIFTKKDESIEFNDSLVGFSDTLDRLDDSVFQPAPLKKSSSNDAQRSVNSINIADNSEGNEKKRSFFNDADFDDVEFSDAPTAAFLAVNKDDEPEDEAETKTDININETGDDEKDEEDTIVADGVSAEPTVQFSSDDPAKEEDIPNSDHHLDYNQTYSSDEVSTDGYDDAQHEIMHAMDFSKALEDVYDNDISASQANISLGHVGEKTPKMERETVKSSNEFTNSAQRKPFLDKYKKLYTSARLKFIGAMLSTIVLTALEAYVSLSDSVPHFIDPVANPRVLVLLSLQLFLITFAFFFESFITGIKSIFKGKITPQILPTFFVIITAVFGIYTAITAPANPTLMFAPCSLCITAALINEYRDLKREISSFKIISSNRVKYCIDKYTPETKTVESDDFYSYLPENPTLLKINKTSFIENFVQNTRKNSKAKSYFLIIPLACLLIAVIVFVAMLILKKGFDSSFSYAFILLSAIIPSSLFTAFSFPLYKASKEAFNDDSTFVGECVADDFSDSAVVSFDDKEVFPSYALKLLSVRVYGENRIDHILYAATSVFKKLGGPLYDVFENASREIEKTDNVKIFSVDTDGIEATVNEEHVLLGSAAFMETKNFIPLYTADDENAEAKNAKRIMYMASGGTIIAKLYLKYTADSDFSLILQHLTDAGMCIAVKTFDPNIDTALLAGDINIKRYPVRVVKCSDASELSETTNSADAVIVSKNSAKSLLKTLTNCRKLSSVIKTGILVSTVSIVIGLMIIGFSLFAGLEGGVASLVIVLYQLLWMIVCNIVSRVYLK